MPALDAYKKQGSDEDGSDGQIGFGLHHETARVACAIVANCRWDGFLSEDKAAGARPVQIGPDDLLLGSNYYFHVPNSVGDMNPEPYPIVPSFAHFQFPHNNLPPTWKASSIPLETTTNSVHARDVSCRITLSTLGTEIAHLIPRRENSWFASNEMGRYSSPTLAATATLTGDARNAILLCSNIHSTFDQRRFVFVPKHGSWVIHVISGTPKDELPAVYHNAQPQQLSGIAVEYLFARFAWTVLSSGMFLHTGVSRRLITLRQEDGVSGVSDVSGEECRTLFAPILGSKSCNNSPRKRVREDEEAADISEEDDDLDELDDSDASVWDTRGRSRKRAFYG
ncbi:uncharacterized protein BBA_09768 [Beauveria bassiana ARSEF 2860]|uniref:HNH nuclease domain-containing protein n=1 Tax=Beauveria bassiana (strain ARSEF 2860) TaxID=655819 RepID=J5J3I2_BEAB2|nr:uncharacterized protein BBA_09768 [Beauveria bassiana ARSEF 2860]EJP61293.1 hypothetical protein BBA_09768 [Beauveria bassiana ARSEF 2860]